METVGTGKLAKTYTSREFLALLLNCTFWELETNAFSIPFVSRLNTITSTLLYRHLHAHCTFLRFVFDEKTISINWYSLVQTIDSGNYLWKQFFSSSSHSLFANYESPSSYLPYSATRHLLHGFLFSKRVKQGILIVLYRQKKACQAPLSTYVCIFLLRITYGVSSFRLSVFFKCSGSQQSSLRNPNTD